MSGHDDRYPIPQLIETVRTRGIASEDEFNYDNLWLWLYPEEVPPLRALLDPVVATLRAVDPKHENQDFDITHAGGSAWESLRGRKHWARDAAKRRAQWQGFSRYVHGIAAPPEQLKALFREGNGDAMRALSAPLRYEPMLMWGDSVDTTDPVKWTRAVQRVVMAWPGALTLVLHGAHLGLTMSSGAVRDAWNNALASLLTAVASRLDGVELYGCTMPNESANAPWLTRCAQTLRTLTRRDTSLAGLEDWSSPSLQRLMTDGAVENLISSRFPQMKHLEVNAERLSCIPEGLVSAVLHYSSPDSLEEALGRLPVPTELCLVGDSLSWTQDRHRLPKRFGALQLQTLGIADPASGILDDTMDADEQCSSLKALVTSPRWPGLRRLWMPWRPDYAEATGVDEAQVRTWLADSEWNQNLRFQLSSGAWVRHPGGMT